MDNYQAIMNAAEANQLMTDSPLVEFMFSHKEYYDWSLPVRIHELNYESTTSGPGNRTELFFQGCVHACEGCFSKETWSWSGGKERTVADLLCILDPVKFGPNITFCGGDPFFQVNELFEIICTLSHYAEDNGIELDLISYSGFSYEGLVGSEDIRVSIIMQSLNALVDRSYDNKQRIMGKTGPRDFIGSDNQRYLILDVNGSVYQTLRPSTANRMCNAPDSGESLTHLSYSLRRS